MRDTDSLIQPFVEEWMARGADDVRIAPYLTWHGLVDDRHVEAQATRAPCSSPVPPPSSTAASCRMGPPSPAASTSTARMPLGNVTKNRFREIWSGNDYRRLRLQMLTGTFPPDSICERCDNTIRERRASAPLNGRVPCIRSRKHVFAHRELHGTHAAMSPEHPGASGCPGEAHA